MLILTEPELRKHGRMVRRPQWRLASAQRQVHHFGPDRNKTAAFVKHQINSPVEKRRRIGQEFIMSPGQSAGRIAPVNDGPGIAEALPRECVISQRPVTMQGVGVEITA